MSFAFAALALFLIALPGILFRFNYRRLDQGSGVFLGTAVEETAYGIAIAAVIHYVLLVVLGLNDNLDYRHLLSLVAGEEEAPRGVALQALTESFWEIGAYLLVSAIIGMVLGWISRITIRFFHLDLYLEGMRFPDKWYYIFNGEDNILMELSENGGKPGWRQLRNTIKSIEGVHVTMVVQQGDQILLYGGIPIRYQLDKGKLDRIILKNPYRLPLPEVWGPDVEEIYLLDGPAPGSGVPYYPISSSLFVVNYSDVRTIGFKYFKVEIIEGQERNASEEAEITPPEASQEVE